MLRLYTSNSFTCFNEHLRAGQCPHPFRFSVYMLAQVTTHHSSSFISMNTWIRTRRLSIKKYLSSSLLLSSLELSDTQVYEP